MGYLSTNSTLAVIKSSWSDIFETPHIPWRGILICAHFDACVQKWLLFYCLFSLVLEFLTTSWSWSSSNYSFAQSRRRSWWSRWRSWWGNLIFRAEPQALVGRRWLVFWDLFLKPKRGNWRWSREVFRDKGVLLGKLVEAEGLWRGLARLSWVGGQGGYRPRLHETNKGLRSRSSSSSLTPNPHPSMTIDSHNFSFSFHSHELVSSTNISWLFSLLLLVDTQSTLLDHIVTTCGAHLSCGEHLAIFALLVIVPLIVAPRRAMVVIV